MAPFDDRAGLVWRTCNLLRRFDPWFALRWAHLMLSPVEIDRPIFVIGIPRSGTTSVFQWLGSAFASLGHEGHNIWRLYHHPRRHGWRSDEVGAGDVARGERRCVYAYFQAKLGERRFVEKTPCNCFRIPYLLTLFPSARFLVVHRNPQPVLRSLISGWKDPGGRFRNYYLPIRLSIPGYEHQRRWCFTLVPGWRDMIDRPIADIAVHQWSEYVDAIVKGRRIVPEGQWLEIHLEDLIASPPVVAEKVYQFLDVDTMQKQRLDGELDGFIGAPANALRPSERVDAGEACHFLSSMAPRARLIGYQFVDGAFCRCFDS
jgi:hypothetical protein